jgi:hypothetical protein
MNKKTLTLLTQISLSAFLLNFFLPGLSFGQGSAPASSTVTITRVPYLSFEYIPSSFSFGAVTATGADQNVFNNADGLLPIAGNLLQVRDTRNSGGFLVQAQATDFTSGTDTINASNLRIISTTQFSTTFDGTEVNDVYYVTGYDGTPNAAATQTVTAPINAATTNFGQAVTFSNALDSAVDILSGCLTGAEGRIGAMAVGLTDNLTVPAYTPPGNYNSTITYTVTDYTEVSCP